MQVLWLKQKTEANGLSWPFLISVPSYAKQCKTWPSQGHHEKDASPRGRKGTKSFKPNMLSSPKQHVLSLWFIQCFWRKWNSSLASKKDLWLQKNRFYLAVGACKVCSVSYQAQLLFILQILILDPVNHCTFLLLGEELHSWNHSQENNPSLPDHPES